MYYMIYLYDGCRVVTVPASPSTGKLSETDMRQSITQVHNK